MKTDLSEGVSRVQDQRLAHLSPPRDLPVKSLGPVLGANPGPHDPKRPPYGLNSQHPSAFLRERRPEHHHLERRIVVPLGHETGRRDGEQGAGREPLLNLWDDLAPGVAGHVASDDPAVAKARCEPLSVGDVRSGDQHRAVPERVGRLDHVDDPVVRVADLTSSGPKLVRHDHTVFERVGIGIAVDQLFRPMNGLFDVAPERRCREPVDPTQPHLPPLTHPVVKRLGTGVVGLIDDQRADLPAVLLDGGGTLEHGCVGRDDDPLPKEPLATSIELADLV